VGRLKRSRLVTRCIFCGRPDLSREHIWPTWSHEFIRKSPRGSHTRRLWERPVQHGAITGEIQTKSHQGDVISSKLKVVCKDHCNSGWMSRLETRAKPILVPLMTGHDLSLGKYNQEILATWIAMKMLIADFLTPEDIFTSSVERSLLMGRRLPPDAMNIWIGRYLGSEASNLYYRHAAISVVAPIGVVPKRPPKGMRKNVHSQTFIIGELFVQVISTATANLIFDVPPKFSGVLRQIWPFRREFEWPPPLGIYDGLARDITTGMDRLRTIRPLSTAAASK
jgi:hypothetical protein